MYIYWCKSLRYKSTCILPGKLPGKMLVLLNASTVGMRPPDIPAAPVEPAAPLPSPPEEEKEERAETQNQGPRAWWHGGEEAVNGDVDCFFGWGANWYFLLMIFGCFFCLRMKVWSWRFAHGAGVSVLGVWGGQFSAPGGVTASDDLLVKTACGGASFEGANIDTKSCPDLQVAKKGLCILYTYDMYWSSVNLDFLTSWVVFVSWLLGTNDIQTLKNKPSGTDLGRKTQSKTT